MSASRRPLGADLATLEDHELVAAIRSGNVSGLGILFDRYGADVRNLLLRLGVNARDVDDLTQDTFLDSIVAAAGFQRGGSVRSWLFGVAVIVMRRHRRSIGRMLKRVERWAAQRVEPRVATPDDELEWVEAAARGQRALSQLSAKKRDAFVLVVIEELSGDEAASALGVSVATLWTRVHYARRELMRHLELDPP
jgi:RNA polymerase sigma-70 factor (ECF subfamily)